MTRVMLILFAICGISVASDAAETDRLSAQVDRGLAAAWPPGFAPAGPASDDEFLRRAYLDLLGRIPRHTELVAFRADSAPDKRAACLDRLFASDEFIAQLSRQLNTLLQGRLAWPMSPAWKAYLTDSLRQGKGWDQMARELLVARPTTASAAGATEFLSRRFTAPEPLDEVTRDVTRLLFGVDMQCARCHTHPEIPEWEPASYWGMAAFFSRTYKIQLGERVELAERAHGEATFTTVADGTQQALPRFMTGRSPPAQDAPLAEEPAAVDARRAAHPMAQAGDPLLDNPAEYLIPPSPDATQAPWPRYSRRQALADLAINGDNPYFARTMVNRVWSWVFGQGLVEPLDQLHSANGATHPEVLELLCRDFVQHGYDLRRLLRVLTGTRAYQQSSRSPSAGRTQADAAARYGLAAVRPLGTWEYCRALVAASGRLEAAADVGAFDQSQGERIGELLRILDSGSDQFQPSVQMTLYLANSPQFATWLTEGGLAARLAAEPSAPAAITLAFETILSRAPDADELAQCGQYLAARTERPGQAIEQLVWSLLNSSEFRFNH